jgi:hypothetical protein
MLETMAEICMRPAVWVRHRPEMTSSIKQQSAVGFLLALDWADHKLQEHSGFTIANITSPLPILSSRDVIYANYIWNYGLYEL